MYACMPVGRYVCDDLCMYITSFALVCVTVCFGVSCYVVLSVLCMLNEVRLDDMIFHALCCFAMLCHDTVCHEFSTVMLCYAMLCYAMLAMPCHAMPCHVSTPTASDTIAATYV